MARYDDPLSPQTQAAAERVAAEYRRAQMGGSPVSEYEAAQTAGNVLGTTGQAATQQELQRAQKLFDREKMVADMRAADIIGRGLEDYAGTTENIVKGGQAALGALAAGAGTISEIQAAQFRLEEGLKEAAQKGQKELQKYLEANEDAEFSVDVLNAAERLTPEYQASREATEQAYADPRFIDRAAIDARQQQLDQSVVDQYLAALTPITQSQAALETQEAISPLDPSFAEALRASMANVPAMQARPGMEPSAELRGMSPAPAPAPTQMERLRAYYEPLTAIQGISDAGAARRGMESPAAQALAMGAPRGEVAMPRPSEVPVEQLRGVRQDVDLSTQAVDDALRPFQQASQARERVMNSRARLAEETRQLDSQLQQIGFSLDVLSNLTPEAKRNILQSYMRGE